MNRKELISSWEKFAESNNLMLNPDKKRVDLIARGALKKKEEKGILLCPCRISDGTKEGDAKLICPCDFKKNEIWNKEGRCWCSLFFKKE